MVKHKYYKKCKKIRKAVILVDYENVSKSATQEGCIVDLAQLINECLNNIGIVKQAFVFCPLYLVTEEKIREFDLAGFDCITCPKIVVNNKEKDCVDSRMISTAKNIFDEHSGITDIVIVSNDGDFTPLVTFFKHRDKKVSLFGLGDISNILKKVIDTVHQLPVKKM